MTNIIKILENSLEKFASAVFQSILWALYLTALGAITWILQEGYGGIIIPNPIGIFGMYLVAILFKWLATMFFAVFISVPMEAFYRNRDMPEEIFERTKYMIVAVIILFPVSLLHNYWIFYIIDIPWILIVADQIYFEGSRFTSIYRKIDKLIENFENFIFYRVYEENREYKEEEDDFGNYNDIS